MTNKHQEKFFDALRTCGHKGRVVSIHRLADLKEEIESRHQQGLFDKDFYKERLSHFDFNPPAGMPEAKSIIVIAVPSAQTGIIFNFQGKSKTVILPPTYVGDTALPPKVESWLNRLLNPMGYRALKTTRLPRKPLAVRSGLAEYGRNNVTYVSGLGSFHHLLSFFSDLPCEQDEWRELKMLERCQKCRACLVKCPSGAIGEDRFLLHAERCLVFHNERSGHIPFPAWMNPSWHNSLLGCMICQKYCPEDREFKNWMKILARFSQEETELLLRGSTRDRLPASTIKKLDLLELTESLDVLPRNMGVLFNREKGVHKK
jgi:epoxyqueuosine reductase